MLAIDGSGHLIWEKKYEAEGSVRSSVAVADVDGDGHPDVLVTLGCYGQIEAYDGATGTRKWRMQLGPRTLGSPSIGDLDGDGNLEVVVASYDGLVYCLGATASAKRHAVLR